MEVIPRRRGEEWGGGEEGDGGGRGGGRWRWEGGCCSLGNTKLEISDSQLGVRAGGWESSFGDVVWVAMGGGL